MTKVKINDTAYPAVIDGHMVDYDWDNRDSKSITLEMSHELAISTFVDNVPWSILTDAEQPVLTEDGLPTGEVEVITTEYDNSEYSIAGDVIDHRNGFVTVKMGKPTDLEDAYEILYGGIE